MSQLVTPYRWSAEEFLRAYDARVFHGRVELVEGEVWPVVIGSWHGKTTIRVARHLPGSGVEITTETLASGDSLADPTAGYSAEARRRVANSASGCFCGVLTTSSWSSKSVTRPCSLTNWSRRGSTARPAMPSTGSSRPRSYVHTSPIPGGYAERTEHRRGGRVRIPYADVELAIDDLLG